MAAAPGELELNALTQMLGGGLAYGLAFIAALFGLKKAVVDGDTKGWIIVVAAALVASFSGLFNNIRGFGYEIIAPLSPSGNSEEKVPFNSSAVPFGESQGSSGGSAAP